MDIGLSSRVGVGIGHRRVIGSTIDTSIDSGGSGISGNWASSISGGGTHNSTISGGGSSIAVSTIASGVSSTSIASGVGEGTSIAVASVGNHLSLGHGGTESDNSDKSLHFVSDL